MILQGLDQKQMAELEGIATTRSFKADEMILREGEPGSSFYIIVAGRLEIRKGTPDHRFTVLAELGVGDVLGEFGFVSDTPRTASAIARSPVTLLVFERARFEPFAEDHPEIGMAIYRNMAKIMSERLVSTTSTLAQAFMVGKNQVTANAEKPHALRPKSAVPAEEQG